MQGKGRARVRSGVWWVLAALVWVLPACGEELSGQEPRGAYLLFRQALFEGDAEAVYELLDKDTRGVFDARYEQLSAMGDQIVRFLPQVDQRLARQQTGVVVLKDKEIGSGKALFKFLFMPKKLEVTPEIEVGTEVSEVELNEEETEAAVVTYSGQVHRLVREEDKAWRVTSLRELAEKKTAWVDGNRTALEQTVSDLINEEQEETDKIIKFILLQEKQREAAAVGGK